MARDVPTRADYPWVCDMPTRWMDNDVYGHVNNVTYYSYFDTAANRYLIEAGGLDIHNAPVVGFVVESGCQYHAPVAFPEQLEAGLRVEHLGNRSVTYGIGIFKAGEDAASAHGHFIHVFVDRTTQRAAAIPDDIRRALTAITRAPEPKA
ncbi:acyl-CoA thioesterase [Salinisphaera aquimarina]|uniref:Acyl-CoA thioesterase n=1 Tax=Salinisphaera aquimarina TaxID=2094031 RepID=A0ABV7EQT9_9GAMM